MFFVAVQALIPAPPAVRALLATLWLMPDDDILEVTEHSPPTPLALGEVRARVVVLNVGPCTCSHRARSYRCLSKRCESLIVLCTFSTSCLCYVSSGY